MKPPTLPVTRSFVFALALPLSVPIFADTLVVLHVDVKNTAALSSSRVPAAGDYTFSFSQNHVRVETPRGSSLVIDFDHNSVSELDPTGKTFTQMKIGDFLALGESLSPPLSNRYSAKTTVVFEPTVGQESRQIEGQSSAPYDFDLTALVTRHQAQSGHSGFGGGRHRGGGGGGGQQTDPDSTGDTSGFLTSGGCRVTGEFWTTAAKLGDVDPDKLDVAEACALFRGAPGLPGIRDKIRKAHLALLGADYSVMILDANGQQPANPPVVSVATSKVQTSNFDASLFTIPAGFSKATSPAPMLGTAF